MIIDHSVLDTERFFNTELPTEQSTHSAMDSRIVIGESAALEILTAEKT